VSCVARVAEAVSQSETCLRLPRRLVAFDLAELQSQSIVAILFDIAGIDVMFSIH
jgi:hypothetical protein